MKSNLKFSKLGEVSEIFAGGDKPSNFSLVKDKGHQVPVFANGETNLGLQGFTDKAKVNRSAVTVSARGTIGYAVLREEPFVPIVRLLTLIPDENKLDVRYLYYYLTLYRQAGLGSSQPQLTVPDIANRKISMQSLSSQQAIGRTLSILDKKIELNNKINAELEAMAKLIYDYWFVQFDFPDENGRPYKSSGGKMVWSEELKREVPEGWKVENLKNNKLAKLIKPGIENFEGNKTYIATADVNENEINFEANKITYENRESRANMQPIQNSIWFAKMKNSKKVMYFGEYSTKFLEDFILSTGFAGIKCNFNYALEYLWGFINEPFFELIKDRLSNGATQEAINNDSMAYIPLVIPDGNILNLYSIRTNSIYRRIYLNQVENQKLSELRDWLLPMLMNGQVKVK